MSVHVIAEVSKGIGLVKQISKDSENFVLSLVCDQTTTKAKVVAEFGERPNVYILHAYLTSHASLKRCRCRDRQDHWDDKVEELEQVSSKLFMTNVVGNIDLFKFLLPPIMKVEGKKVIAISSSHADFDFVYNLEVETRFLYSASKTALNAIVAKFNAQYKKDGALFMSMSRGVVEVDQFNNVRSDQMQGLMSFVGKIVIYVPDFSGTTLVGDTIPIIKSIWEKASIESGSSGASVSHHGTKQWI